MNPIRPWSSFDALVHGISALDRAAFLAVGRHAHQLLSLRNWLVGAWIIQYEQDGADRAAYGARLLPRLAASLADAGHRGLSARNLANCRLVALAYPALDASIFGARLLGAVGDPEILQTSAKSLLPSSAASLPWRDGPWIEGLFSALTFSHLLELARIDDPVERACSLSSDDPSVTGSGGWTR